MATSSTTLKDQMMRPKIMGIGILVILALIILLQNSQSVSFRVVFWEVRASLIILLPAALLVGFIVGYVVCATRSRSRRSERGISGS